MHVRWKLCALWCSVVFLYIYGDYFELYQPGKLSGMVAGTTVFGGISQGVLLGMASIMVMPCLMPVISLILPAGLSRWMNLVFGAVYTLAMILAIRGGWHFYVLFGLLEIGLTLGIVWCAWRWPKAAANKFAANPLH